MAGLLTDATGLSMVGSLLNSAGSIATGAQQAKVAQQNEEQQANLRSQALGNVGTALNQFQQTPQTASGGAMVAAGDYARALDGNITSGAPSVAGADPRYAAAQAAGAGRTAAYINPLAQAVAQMTGFQRAQQQNQMALQNASTNIANLQSQSYTDDLVNQMREQSIKTNPYVTAVANMLGSEGSTLAKQGGGPTTPAGDPAINAEAGLATPSAASLRDAFYS